MQELVCADQLCWQGQVVAAHSRWLGFLCSWAAETVLTSIWAVCCHVFSAPLFVHATEHGAEVILGVRNTAAGEKLAKEIM
jgi:hypothetical protein